MTTIELHPDATADGGDGIDALGTDPTPREAAEAGPIEAGIDENSGEAGIDENSGELAAQPDSALLALVQSEPQGSRMREDACAILVRRYQALVRSCVLKYRDSPEPTEELMQVGYVGLLKAINNFDPEIGGSLAAYAQPCVSGEVKRHFRDKRWQVHVRRSAQELRLEIRKARGELAQELSRTPTDAEMAEHLGISAADLLDAQRADLAFQASSLDAPLSDGNDAGTLADVLGCEDPQLEQTLEMDAVWGHLSDLPEREQNLLLMRFYGNMTQTEIGDELGISQMHVSRLLAHALAYLREQMLDHDEERLIERRRLT